MSSHIEVTVKNVEPVTAASISMKGPYTQITEAFGKLFGWIGEKGLVPSGPPMGVFFNAPGEVPDEQLLWEIRSPVAGDVRTSGPDERGLGVKRVDEMQVASTMHRGPFDQVGATWDAITRWIADNGYQIVGPGIEVYLSDPEKTPPEELLTEVRFPVRKTGS